MSGPPAAIEMRPGSRWLAVAGVVVTALWAAAGCTFAPDFPSGAILCGTAPAYRCPGGLMCERPAGVCVAPGTRSQAADAGGGDGPSADGPRPLAVPSGNDCDVLNPAACGTGQTCRTFCAGNAALVARCEAVGPAVVGEICAEDRRCGARLACAQYTCDRAGALRMCERFCTADTDCPGDGKCRPLRCADAAGAYRTCSNPCDPLPGAAVTCPQESACQLNPGDDASCGCERPASVQDGARCDDTDLGRCAGGLICADERGARVCRPVCRRDAAACATGRACLPVPGYEKFGACIPGVGAGLTPTGCDAVDPGSCGPGRACRIGCGGEGSGTSTCETFVMNQGRPAGAPCTLDFFCAAGMRCLATACGQTVVRFCERLCKSNADCEGDSGQCLGIRCDGQPSPFRICSRSCDPLGATSGCPPGLVCSLSRGDRTGCGCARPNAGDIGAPCRETTDCLAGQVCTGTAGGSTCRRICRLSTDDCAAGTRCSTLPDQRVFGACLPAVTPAVCDPTSSETCPATGTGCAPVCDPLSPTAVGARCGPAGSTAPGQPCVAQSDCVPGSACLRTCGDGVAGTCVRYCRADVDCGGGSARCLPLGCAGQNTPYGRCTTNCDPTGAATTGCPERHTCLLSSGETTDCACPRPSQVGGDGDACDGALACRPGFTCVFEGKVRLCRALCRLPGPSSCPPDRACSPLPDQRSFGACVPPLSP